MKQRVRVSSVGRTTGPLTSFLIDVISTPLRLHREGEWKPPWPPWPPPRISVNAMSLRNIPACCPRAPSASLSAGCPTEKFSGPASCLLLPIQVTCAVSMPVTTPHQGHSLHTKQRKPIPRMEITCHSLLKIETLQRGPQPVNFERDADRSSEAHEPL